MLKPFVAPMQDEVGLLARAAEKAICYKGCIPNREALQRLVETQGIDLATAIFYQSILASSTSGPFIGAVDAEAAAPISTTSRARVLLVPALYYQELPQYGGDGQA